MISKFSDQNSKIYKFFPHLLHTLWVLTFFSILYTIFFSPVLFSNRLLSPGDAWLYYLPAFYSSRTLWTNLILSGFPLAADPQIQTWYPISFFFSLIFHSWNAFVISAYLLASSFTYGYVFTITKSRFASLVSGIIYGMSGFMVGHLGHTSIIHAAMWMPLSIWALEKLRHKFSPLWLTLGTLAVCCSILSGHPQIAVYTLGLIAIYALILGGSAPIGKWKYYRLYLIVTSLGIALTAIQLIPTAELSSLGLRSKMTFEEFNSYSLPPIEAVKLLFPYLLGGIPASSPPYSSTYFGTWNLVETTGYIGLLPLILAAVGLLSRQHIGFAKFWLGVAIMTFLLTLSSTPLSWITFHIPVYNKFRAPARHFIEMALAVSILSGIAVAAIQKRVVSFRLLGKTILISTAVMLVVLIGIFLSSSSILRRIKEVANSEEAAKFSFLPWSNPAIGIPILVFVLVIVGLMLWSQFPHSRLLKLFFLSVLIIDLSSFGWFFEWKNGAINRDFLTPTAYIQKYRDILNTTHQRLLPIFGGMTGDRDEIVPNSSMLWNVPSASGYGPLILSRVSKLLEMNPGGQVQGNWNSTGNRSLDIISVRYILMPKPTLITNTETKQGIFWSREDMNLFLGSGCGIQGSNSKEFQVPTSTKANAIGIVSYLGCSEKIANNAQVLSLSITDSKGTVVNQSLRAGRDTSEFAYECSDVRPLLQHQQAPVFESFLVQRKSLPNCKGHKYVSILPLERLQTVKTFRLKSIGSSGVINIQKLSLIDDKTRQSYPITKLSETENITRWRYVEDINQVQIYENLQAMPRAWVVPEVMPAKPDEILTAIQSSKLPDGRSYNPSQIALVEEPLNFKTQNLDAAEPPKVVELSKSKLQIQTNFSSPAFLVLSDVYYPGWYATIDGNPTHIYQTNYILRGVKLPPGNHDIVFEFKPISFHIGVGISTSSLLLIGYLSWRFSQKQKPRLVASL